MRSQTMAALGVILFGLITGILGKNPYFVNYHSTKVGKATLGGSTEKVNIFGKDYSIHIYRGIPYAEPPVGKLRFKPPVPNAVPDGYNATGFGDSCFRPFVNLCLNNTLITDPMYHTKQSEDCLYLNVYSPVDASQTKPKAVLVFIQSCGGWIMADGQLQNGMVLSALGDVIVVTFNYRVGAFGFLSTGVKGTEANVGLKDQTEVLRWVKSNIGYLGGDKDRVTLYGIHSGGVNAALHGWVNKKATGLLKRVIISSRPSASTTPEALGFVQNPNKYASLMANFAGCKPTKISTVADTKGLLECLRKKSATEIYQASTKVQQSGRDPNKPLNLVWGPTIDDDIIPLHPSLYHNPGTYQNKDIDVMLGVRKSDGIHYNTVLESQRLFFSATNQSTHETHLTEQILKTDILPRFLHAVDRRDAVVQATFQEYFSDLPSDASFDQKRKDRFTELVNDNMCYSSIFGLAELHAKTSKKKTFVYHFTQEDSTEFHGLTIPRSQELPYVFGDLALVKLTKMVRPNVAMDATEKITKVDEEMTRAVVFYFANFIKFGNPNGDMSDPTRPKTYPQWPEYTTNNQQYLDIGSDKTNIILKAKKDLRAKQVSFWLDYVPFLMKRTCPKSQPCPTCPPLDTRYVGNLQITVGQAQAVIVTLAVGTAIFGCLALVICFACSSLRKKLKEAVKVERQNQAGKENPAFSSGESLD